jgi:hypothetical protein
MSSTARSEHAPCSVHIVFAHTQGPRLRRSGSADCGGTECLWTERPILMARPSGVYELVGTTENMEALARWVLSHGAAAEVKGPLRLQRRVAVEARRVWHTYRDQC